MNQEFAAASGLAGALLGILGAVFAIFLMRKVISSIWAPLSARFPLTNPDFCGELKFRSMAVRLNSYASLNLGCCTALTITDQSIRIRIQRLPIIPGLSFPPVELPWSAIENVELKRSLFGYPIAIVRMKDFSPVLTFAFSTAELIYEKWAHLPGRGRGIPR